MKKKHRKALTRYARLLADEVGLRDWQIKVSPEPCDPSSSAHVTIAYGRKLATISVPDDFRDQAPEEQRNSVVHELVHCHFESMANAVQNDLVELLGRPADGLFFASFRRQYEYGTDAVAEALARHLPLIDWKAT